MAAINNVTPPEIIPDRTILGMTNMDDLGPLRYAETLTGAQVGVGAGVEGAIIIDDLQVVIDLGIVEGIGETLLIDPVEAEAEAAAAVEIETGTGTGTESDNGEEGSLRDAEVTAAPEHGAVVSRLLMSILIQFILQRSLSFTCPLLQTLAVIE